MAAPTWPTVEQPVLEAIVAAEGVKQLNSNQLAEQTGLPKGEVRRAIRALVGAGYVTAGLLGGSPHESMLVMIGPLPTERARRQVGQWPADGFDALLAVLAAKIGDEAEPEARSRLERLRDAVVDIGRDVATDVIGAAIKHGTGI